ncbi:MAG: hypothetical protein AVDCRST_MAG14-448 [uncultured Rubrobacteraceae bacterium]|uniref:Uncharacterized protein n=1 Tax=uncultured Rubrobacteraceae bacterium TaxID=349277 RepID=A0A6J4QSW8_9ACTN|nr:MAG: hypothetical protein AVDCRST_MAG14-448 [uncultured Rubrobacteraceae bacterium]
MPSLVTSSGETNISDYANNSSSGHKHPIAMTPHSVKLIHESFIVFYIPELVWMIVVLLEGPVRWGSDNQMDRIVGDPL